MKLKLMENNCKIISVKLSCNITQLATKNIAHAFDLFEFILSFGFCEKGFIKRIIKLYYLIMLDAVNRIPLRLIKNATKLLMVMPKMLLKFAKN